MSAREGAERWLHEMAAQASVETPPPRTPAKPAKAVKPAPKTPAVKGREPKPVKGWLPGDKASTKAP